MAQSGAAHGAARIQGSERPGPQRRSIKVVFVLDELDKLDAVSAKDASRSPLDEVLESLKTVFTSTAFSFIFIAGKELRERWTHEVALGDSIYESVFAHDIYLPCLWHEQDELLRRVLVSTEAATSEPDGALEPVLRYLAYKGRGIPRRLWRELNRHVGRGLWSENPNCQLG